MSTTGYVKIEVQQGVGRIRFFHPKKNSLPGQLLKELTAAVNTLSGDPEVRVVLLSSDGDGPFCSGASFDELLAIDSFARGKEFFMGFARLILAMRRCPRFIITRVQGKAVGGGLGIIAASDYVLALDTASIKLSELALGIGPFVIGPAVERKMGLSAFHALAIDTGWRDASWARDRGLYVKVFSSLKELDGAVEELALQLSKYNPEAMAKLKSVFWEGTDHWVELLEARAEMSGRLVLSDFTVQAIQAFKSRL